MESLHGKTNGITFYNKTVGDVDEPVQKRLIDAFSEHDGRPFGSFVFVCDVNHFNLLLRGTHGQVKMFVCSCKVSLILIVLSFWLVCAGVHFVLGTFFFNS